MELTLQELIDAATNVGPDATEDQRAEAVAALLAERGADAEVFSNEALEQYTSIREGGDGSDDTMRALGALVDVIAGARVRQTQVTEAAKARAEELAALDAKVAPAEDPEGGDTPAGEDDPGEGGEDESGAGDGDPTDPPAGEADPADTPAGEPAGAGVTAGARPRPVRVNLAQVRRPAKTQKVDTEDTGRAVITASADVPNVPAGAVLDRDGLTNAVISRMSAFPTERIQGAVMRAGIARIKLPFTDKRLVANGSESRDQDVLDYAGSQHRLKGKSLTAAGGWCSPSTTYWDLCPGLESANAGMVDVPDIQVTRGGIRTTEGPDIAAVFSSIGFKQTEAQAIAGDTKPCYRVPCPPFVETRAGVTGVCIVSGILQDDAYPEMTRRVVDLAMAVHAHKVNADTIAAMVTASTDLGTINAGISATTSVLNVIEMQVVDYRYRYRADTNLILELIAPIWIKAVIRADLSLRTGVPFAQVTDQQINGFFAAIGVAPQFVYDWQDAFVDAGVGFGATAPVEAWPDGVQMMIYAAGAFVRGRGEVISMEGIYDAAQLTENDFTRLFMEEKFLVTRRCYQARRFTVPLAVNGATGCCVEVDANGNVVVPTP